MIKILLVLLRTQTNAKERRLDVETNPFTMTNELWLCYKQKREHMIYSQIVYNEKFNKKQEESFYSFNSSSFFDDGRRSSRREFLSPLLLLLPSLKQTKELLYVVHFTW